MAKSILFDQLHVSIYVSRGLPEPVLVGIRRTLKSTGFHSELRRGVRGHQAVSHVKQDQVHDHKLIVNGRRRGMNDLYVRIVGGTIIVAILATVLVNGGWMVWLPVGMALFTAHKIRKMIDPWSVLLSVPFGQVGLGHGQVAHGIGHWLPGGWAFVYLSRMH